MASFRTLSKTLKVTKNPFDLFPLRLGRERTITFRNGSRLQITWHQFVIFRDCYTELQKYYFEKADKDLFKISNNKSSVTCSSSIVPTVCSLMKKYQIERIENDEFRIKNSAIELIGSSDMLNCVKEQDCGEYSCNCQGKTVLDVGGFQGESAVFFSKMGAKKVIVYEPVTSHHKYIKENISLNHVNAEVHQEGIGEKDGIVSIKCEEANAGFGLPCQGKQEIKIRIRNISHVIKESKADIAKIDCEGSEECLCRVTSEILRKIPLYIIEVHSSRIRTALLERIKESGFKLTKEVAKTTMVSVLFFERQDY
jgi:FkbM family methyltransferase